MRTLIALSVFLIQGCSGVGWVVGYMGYFLELSGMEGDAVFNTTLGIAGLMVTGCMVSSFLVELLGRRKLVVSGMFIMTVCLLLIGILSLFLDKGNSIVRAQISFMGIWAFVYQASTGAAGYAVIVEVPTSSLRGDTQFMATAVNGLCNIVWAVSMPYMVNLDEGNLSGKAAFVFFGVLFMCDFFVFFCYPETKEHTFSPLSRKSKR